MNRLVPRLTLGLLALLGVELVLFALDTAFPPDLGKAERASAVVLDRQGAWLRALPVERGRWRIRADLQRTDSTFVRRLIAVEDARYWLHPGIDPLALARAAASDLLRGRIVSGGSTLTLQTARRLEPRPRTFAAKALDALRALQLQARFTKSEILALYLTLAPYGGNLEGVRAASLAYFGHEPTSLTDAEQAMLIALPQSPEARRPDRHQDRARAARHQVLMKLLRMRMITAQAAAEADADPPPARRNAFPSLAWQASGQLARRASPRQPTVIATLDAGLQTRLEALAAAAAKAEGESSAAAILVVELNGRAVRASVSGAGRDAPGGWMDLTRALRSPGSSLKPFIYAMAFDEGLAAPDTKLSDAPTRFAGYLPENFDRTFHGLVSVREALAYSLNVPAVTTLQKLGPEAFESRLRSTGADLVRPRSRLADPGLALALGGAGISLRDIALLYAALGDEGRAKPLAWTEAEARRRLGENGVRLVGPDAAQQVLDILRESPPPKGRAPPQLTASGPRLAFKTGTSYGYRDAVAAGVGGGYAVVVWTGRPDGGARSAGFTGREAALPLLFDAFDALRAEGAAPQAIAPAAAPAALQTLEAEPGAGPRLLFPPNGASLNVDGFGPQSRGLALAAVGERLSWYVEGRPLNPTPQGDVIWRPAAPGFYRIVVVAPDGRRAEARVRVRQP